MEGLAMTHRSKFPVVSPLESKYGRNRREHGLCDKAKKGQTLKLADGRPSMQQRLGIHRGTVSEQGNECTRGPAI
eukprot:16269179-Heterocapsa_arctica.AAC.1